MNRIVIGIWLVMLVGSCSERQEIRYTDSSLPIDQRVADLLSKMTIDEKVAQMRIFHANLGIELDENEKLKLSDKVKGKLQNGIAGIKNPGEHLTPSKAALLNNQLQKYIIDNNRLGIPALFVTESYNGVDAFGSTKFGRPITMASSWDTVLVNKVWDVIGREARLRGMHMCHSPEADIVRDPRFGRMSEACSEDTHLTTEMVVSAIKGVQGDYVGLGNGTHIGAVAKHFAGYGQVLGGTNFAAIEISPRTLIDEIYPPFQAAVQRANTAGVMASHGDLNGIASHGNHELLTGVLRDEWGFQGYVVSDANDIGRLHYFMKVAETPEAAAIMGLTAGVDIDLYADDAYALLPEIVKVNPEIVADIDKAVARVLRTKFILGLFENPYIEVEAVAKGVHNQKSLDLALEADLESIILLKNENNILPINKTDYKKIALVGPLFDSTALWAFQQYAGNQVDFFFEKGFELTDGDNSVPQLNSPENFMKGVDRILQTVKKSDLVILFAGGDNSTAKEAFFNGALGDRHTIDPIGPQDELIEKIRALGIPVIVVLKHRRTLSINAIAEKANAILDCWDLSEMGNQAITKIMYGEVSPSGKLPVTIPRSIGQLPFHYSQKEINYKKGYLFLNNTPLYPFGFGLSYGDFKYSNLQLSANTIAANGKIAVSIDVTNNGNMQAKEVVQLYIKDMIGSVTRPDKELKAFSKIALAAGETKTVMFTITDDMLLFTGKEMKKILEPGDYKVLLGGSSITEVESLFKLVGE